MPVSDVKHAKSLETISTNPGPEHSGFTRPLSLPPLKQKKVVQYRGEEYRGLTQLKKHEFRILAPDDKSTCSDESASVAYRIGLIENRLLEHVSTFLNNKGGKLIYGVFSYGIVWGEKISKTEFDQVRQTIQKKIDTMAWPKDVLNREYWDVDFIPVEDKTPLSKLHVIEISVKTCNEGIYFNEKVREVSTATASVKHVKGVHENVFNKWFEASGSHQIAEMKSNYKEELEKLEWVESSNTVHEHEKSVIPRLEIVCKFGKVPHTEDIVNLFDKEILAITHYKELSKTEWFETYILDENFQMKEEYERELSSLSWIEDFFIGFDSEKENTWQIYITYTQNEAPSMVELKKIFDVEIASFVDFIKGSSVEPASENKENLDKNPEGTDKKSLLQSGFLTGPRLGDGIYTETDEEKPCGTVGILAALFNPPERHCVITAYHVAYKEVLPDDIFEAHEKLKKDCSDGYTNCKDVIHNFRVGGRIERGKFSFGLYDGKHDIAVITLQGDLNCEDANKYLSVKGVETKLASKKEVGKRFRNMGGQVPVRKFGSVSRGRKGVLYAVDGKELKDKMNKGFYRIRTQEKDDEKDDKKRFAKKGDSGSLVYMICDDGKKIPFAYISNMHDGIYYCQNMKLSLDALGSAKDSFPIYPCIGKCGSNNS